MDQRPEEATKHRSCTSETNGERFPTFLSHLTWLIEIVGSNTAQPWTLGPLIDDDELEVRDLAAQIRRDYERLSTLFNTDDGDPFNDVPPTVLASVTTVIGYYGLGDVVIPVFAHQADGYRRRPTSTSTASRDGASSYFEDTPPPYPSKRSVAALV